MHMVRPGLCVCVCVCVCVSYTHPGVVCAARQTGLACPPQPPAPPHAYSMCQAGPDWEQCLYTHTHTDTHTNVCSVSYKYKIHTHTHTCTCCTHTYMHLGARAHSSPIGSQTFLRAMCDPCVRVCVCVCVLSLTNEARVDDTRETHTRDVA